MHLFAINYKGQLCPQLRVKLLWSSNIFFLHLHDVNIITKRNWIIATISKVFLYLNEGNVLPHRTTSEPCEHTFGHARSMQREFGQIVSKISKRFEIFGRNNFVSSRETKQKGYGTNIENCHVDRDRLENISSGISIRDIRGSPLPRKLFGKLLWEILSIKQIKWWDHSRRMYLM